MIARTIEFLKTVRSSNAEWLHVVIPLEGGEVAYETQGGESCPSASNPRTTR